MPIRLWQEIKALRWPWLAAFALTLAFPYAFVLALAALLVAGSVFGRDFGEGTIGWVLSQPVSRHRLWWERLGIATAAVALLALLPLRAGQDPLHVALLGAGALASAIAFSLLSRHEWGGLAFGAGMPFVLLLALGLSAVFRDLSRIDTVVLLTRLGVVYVVASFVAGYVVLLRLEDRGAVGAALGALPMPWTPGRGSALRALLVKELSLQKGSLIFILPLIGLLLYAHTFTEAEAMPLIGSLCSVVVLIGALTIGAFGMGEERTLGTLETQLAQPVSGSRQFVVKLGVVWAATLVCAGLPWALAWIPRGVEPEHLKPWMLNPQLSALGCLLAATATLLAAEFSGGVVQALGKAIAIACALLVTFSFDPSLFFTPFDVRLLVVILAALAATTWLAWRNFGIAPRDRFVAVCGAVTGAVIAVTVPIGIHSGWYVWSGARDCLRGNGSACLSAAAAYQTGLAVPRLPRLANWLLERACKQAATPANDSFHRVVVSRGGDGASSSMDLFRDGDPARACLHLGRMRERGANGVERDATRAASYYADACEVGYPPGCDALVAMLDGGSAADEGRTRQALSRGIERMKGRCEELADTRACLWLADALREGRWTPLNPEAAASYARRACRAGEPRGCDRVVALIAETVDAERVESGLAWVARQLDRQCGGVRPSPLPCAKLGRAYEAGRGVPRDVEKGRALLATYCPLASSGRFQMSPDWLAESNPWDALHDSTWWSDRAADLARTCDGFPLEGAPASDHLFRRRELPAERDPSP